MTIGGWTAEPSLNSLRRDGRSVKLHPLTMDVLVHLADHAGDVVSVQELIEAVWHGRNPDDTQVYKTVTRLRKAFGDHRENARYIETIPKRGYRLVAPVARLDTGYDEQAERLQRSNRAAAKVQVAGRAGQLTGRMLGLGAAGVALFVMFIAADRYTTEELPNQGATGPVDFAEHSEEIPTESTAAYALYLRSLSTLKCCPEIQYLDQAIELDPEFALAYATKAYSVSYRTGFDSAERERIVRENATKALALDPTLGFAHAALAFLHMTSRRWAEAETAFQQALRWGPSDPRTLLLYSRFKRYRGQYAEAIKYGQRAVEEDPFSHVGHFHLGATYLRAKDFDAAAAAFRLALELNPSMWNARFRLATTEIFRGDHAEAFKQLRIFEEYPNGLKAIGNARLGRLAYAYAQLGLHDDAARIVGELRSREATGPTGVGVSLAMGYLAIGDHERALQQLERAVGAPNPNLIELSEMIANVYDDPLLDDARFVELLDRVGVF